MTEPTYQVSNAGEIHIPKAGGLSEQELRELDKELSWLYEVTHYGKAFLSPRIREQIIALVKKALPY